MLSIKLASAQGQLSLKYKHTLGVELLPCIAALFLDFSFLQNYFNKQLVTSVFELPAKAGIHFILNCFWIPIFIGNSLWLKYY